MRIKQEAILFCIKRVALFFDKIEKKKNDNWKKQEDMTFCVEKKGTKYGSNALKINKNR